MRRKNMNTQLIKESISKSLLELMYLKNFSDISIIEIVDKAGVNRSTYYRNFASKEEIIKFYFNGIMNSYLEEFNRSAEKTLKNYLGVLFTHFYKNKSEFLLIYKNGLSHLILEALNCYFENSTLKPNADIRRQYITYFHVGGIYNFYMLWFTHDMKEKPEELTNIALSLFPENFRPLLIASSQNSH